MGLLSMDAIQWLKEHGYANADHETRMRLIAEVKEIFGED